MLLTITECNENIKKKEKKEMKVLKEGWRKKKIQKSEGEAVYYSRQSQREPLVTARGAC